MGSTETTVDVPEVVGQIKVLLTREAQEEASGVCGRRVEGEVFDDQVVDSIIPYSRASVVLLKGVHHFSSAAKGFERALEGPPVRVLDFEVLSQVHLLQIRATVSNPRVNAVEDTEGKATK